MGGWVVNATPRPLYPPGKNPVPIVQEAGWTSGPVWTDAEDLATTGIRSPDRPAHSESLYRLSYPGLRIVGSVEFEFHCVSEYSIGDSRNEFGVRIILVLLVTLK